MKPFTLSRASDPFEAIAALTANPDAKFIAGGTNLIDLMKEGVEGPPQLIDIRRLELSAISEIEAEGEKGLRIGALATNTDAANHPLVRQRFPALAEALLSGASVQLRNMATVGGNLMQRTRCPYFTDVAQRTCNKRSPGSGCGARGGYQRYHAVLGASDKCIAVNPSDMAVALTALDAIVNILGPQGTGRIPMADLHRLPGDQPYIDTNLGRDELILSVDLPATPLARRSHYLKVRDRASFAFALVSAAVAINAGPDGAIREARIVLGGVAHKPWRSEQAESELTGKRLDDDAALRRAAEAALAGARPLPGNAYKIALAQETIVRALSALRAE